MAKKRSRSRNNAGSGGRPSRNGRPGGGNRRRRSGSGGGGGGQRSGGNGGRRNYKEDDNVEVDESELTEYTGLLEMHPNGYGFLRSPENNYSEA